MAVQRTLAVLLVQLDLERRALKGGDLDFGRGLGHGIDLARTHEHVEDDAEELDHHAILAGLHRGGAGLEGAAGHLAEEFARRELGDGAVDG